MGGLEVDYCVVFVSVGGGGGVSRGCGSRWDRGTLLLSC